MASPIKFSFKTEWFAVSIIVISLMAALFFYQNFPAQVPTHWDMNGKINGYSGPFMAAFLVPIMMIGLYVMFLFLPYLDPKKEQYLSFASTYHRFKDLIIAFLAILFFLTGLNGLGYQINIGFYIPIMVGAFFVIIGLLLEKVKMNWFLGIRTPWTMSSETVWNKTHKLSSRILAISGVLIAATVLVPAKLRVALFILAIALIVFALPVYSYILFRQEKKEKK
jgi:uncharacterized membrane protein